MKQFKILGSSQPTDSIQEGTIASAQAYGYDSGIKKTIFILKKFVFFSSKQSCCQFSRVRSRFPWIY